jgi:hypothetical protein
MAHGTTDRQPRIRAATGLLAAIVSALLFATCGADDPGRPERRRHGRPEALLFLWPGLRRPGAAGPSGAPLRFRERSPGRKPASPAFVLAQALPPTAFAWLPMSDRGRGERRPQRRCRGSFVRRAATLLVSCRHLQSKILSPRAAPARWARTGRAGRVQRRFEVCRRPKAACDQRRG